ncbi:Zinc finger MIZ-type [Trinorchestia longiramus]|nr:Zinc finger MIZ-type [Trinorchestia longiramus]
MRVFYNEIFTFLKLPVETREFVSLCRNPCSCESIMAMIEKNRRCIRQCADIVFTDFKNMEEQGKLLLSLREVTVTMVEAEQKLVDQQVAIAEAEASVKELHNNWSQNPGNSPQPTLESVVKVHSDTIQAVMKEQQKIRKKTIDSDPDIQYIDKLIRQSEEMAKGADTTRTRKSTVGSSARPGKGMSDLEMLSSMQDLNIVDPVTKKIMTDPVRHKLCGHVYDKVSILQMIKGHGRKGFRCPYMGCACRESIKERHLEPALDYQLEIQRRNDNVSRPHNPSKFPS